MGDDRWRFGATNPIPSFDTSGGLHLSHWSPRLMTSGPILKGKLWFHTAFDPFYTANTVNSLPRAKPNQQFHRQRSHPVPVECLRLADADRQHSLQPQQCLAQWSLAAEPTETTVDQRSALFVATIKDQFIVNGNLVEAGFANTR